MDETSNRWATRLAHCSSLLAIKAQRERETALLLDARALKKIESPQAGRSAVLMSKFARMHHTTKNWRCEDTDIARRGSWEITLVTRPVEMSESQAFGVPRPACSITTTSREGLLVLPR